MAFVFLTFLVVEDGPGAITGRRARLGARQGRPGGGAGACEAQRAAIQKL